MSEEKQIKFVKKANMWVCSWWERVRGKDKQEQKWFNTKEKAEVFANSNSKEKI